MPFHWLASMQGVRAVFLFCFCVSKEVLKEIASRGCRATGFFLKHARAFATVPSAYEQQKAALCRLRNVFFGGFILSKQLNQTAATAAGDETTQMDGQVSSYSSAQSEKCRNRLQESSLKHTYHCTSHLHIPNVVGCRTISTKRRKMFATCHGGRHTSWQMLLEMFFFCAQIPNPVKAIW